MTGRKLPVIYVAITGDGRFVEARDEPPVSDTFVGGGRVIAYPPPPPPPALSVKDAPPMNDLILKLVTLADAARDVGRYGVAWSAIFDACALLRAQREREQEVERAR
jgi:hypothetical protein